MKRYTTETLKFFWKHAKAYPWTLCFIFIALVVAVIGSMGWAFVYKYFFDTLVSPGAKEEIFQKLLVAVIAIAAIEMTEWIGWRAARFLSIFFQPRVMANIGNECFEYLHRHSYNFFNSNFTGALVKRINRMMHAFETVADKICWDLVPMALRILIVGSTLFWLHRTLGIILAVWAVIFLVLNYVLSIYKLKFDMERAESDTRVTAALADTITNNINVKLFAALPFELKRFRTVTEDWFQKVKKSWRVDEWIDAGQAILMIGLEIAVMVVAIHLWRDNLLTVGDFVLIQSYLLETFHQLWNFGRVIRELYKQLAEAEEMTVVLKTPHAISDKPHAKLLHVMNGSIEFRNVQFSYTDDREVIRNLSLRVKPSEKIALIGPSGGGKSTVVKLLLRLFDVQRGEILIDGQNIAQVTQDSLHMEIALVPQDPILFHRSLMENIRYGRRDASNEEVIAASRLAHCHEFISKFPKGYDTFVGERGVKLSGGERQRVAIARAILSNARILILDEATSQLDSESERLIQEALLHLMKQKTTIVIAHRLSTVMKMDRVFVLQDGQIIEEGDHASLVTKKDSLYKRFWDLQIGGYLDTEH